MTSENLTSDYGWSGTEVPPSCTYLGTAVEHILGRVNACRVLDIGCGNGALCGRLAAAGYRMVGMEFDTAGFEVAKATYPQIPFYNFGVQDDPAHLLAAERPFDAVVSTEVVEHLFSPHLLPQYARAVLKVPGHIVLTTPYHGYLKNLALSVLGAWDRHHTALWHGGHIKFWSRATLAQLLDQNGFNVAGFAGVGRMPYLWKSMVMVGEGRG
jgi:2-polyprenyl-3-methyl-5-hydroxy-6-metoxy-1,4-benzoquinol methylase